MTDPNLSPPAYPGGERGVLYYLAQNIQYPIKAVKNNIQGTVVLTFIIEKTAPLVT